MFQGHHLNRPLVSPFVSLTQQLYLPRRCGGPFLKAFAQGVGDGDELSGDGGDYDLVRFSGVAVAICGGVQFRVVMYCDQGRLEHHVPQGMTTTGKGPLSAKGSAVVRDRRHANERGSLFAGDGVDLGYFCDQYRINSRAVPRDRA